MASSYISRSLDCQQHSRFRWDCSHSGIDRFASHPGSWSRFRFAMVTNEAATTASYIPSRRSLLDQGFRIVKLFAPEHGLDAIGEDGHFMAGSMDALTQLPVV